MGEQAERLKLLRRNLERHSSGESAGPWSMGKRGGTADAEELDWFTPGPPVSCDLVLATDVVYTEEVTLALVRCLQQQATPAILSVELRTEEVHTVFIEALGQAQFSVFRLPLSLIAPEVQTRRVVTYVVVPPGQGEGSPEVAASSDLAQGTSKAKR